MASTTPTSAPPSRARSASRTRNNLPSRPTTPLRPHSRTSLRASTTTPTTSSNFSSSAVPLEALEPAFGELADGMADLEANMMHLQLLHESLNRFNECFGAFLYGMNMSAFCVDFPEAPGIESFRRAAEAARNQAQQDSAMSADVHHRERDVDATFLTTDTSFVENPPTPKTTRTNRSTMVPPSTTSSRTTRGASSISRGRGTPAARGTRAGGIAGSTRGSAIGRGRGRGIIR
ncbi:hypothetical protein D6C78_09261 [Aureobasidium pullulans]|uniref:DASH complex subunit DAM1 n=1 Tax=Aureobasidium pullulans TaxID=5580 RepID=A0A4T0E7N0_AURPU|nr:hypothetical protein D6D21_06028 [Aureobasidium pullulans]THX66275.1 hypothetical protein D6D08_07314 [Aureobasidium pullulans]THY26879.1 hypothetical protein D6D00_05322 [Aureobasidium pullulans]THY85916.1 hypothetical protein D6C93_08057 [Aureobasidium pullulans]THY99713.1 hypothetical protein D6C92_02184 [Aureobasidium pullulans]